MYGVFTKPVSAVECTVYTTAIFKHHTIKILRKYLPLYTDADRRDMLAQVSLTKSVPSTHLIFRRNVITCSVSHMTFPFR